MSKYLLTIVFSAYTMLLLAQTTAEKSKLPFEFTVSAGGEIHSFSGLNTRLEALDAAKAKTFLFSAGLGVAYRFNHVLIGLGVNGGSSGFDWLGCIAFFGNTSS
ncbi:hypothetical protein SAMN05421747_102119 [Parapedobacter composti]|uniref:Outer membrane protein beta-barrel domain-containing protein n=1 Tax=Parapedobacter composti TaxID=623281 RepID=A0A1I1EZL4_9SPHI|nr:hypothetical protein [Parapedobacter composti]SFB92176.1 hypothetical protein SAMN05421747_102119 [Parapedobacter composti]